MITGSAKRLIAVGTWAALAATGLAQDGAGGVPADELRWRLDARPGVWYVAPAGKLKMPASPSIGAGERYELDDLNLDSPRLAPFAEIDVRRGDWGINVSGFAFSASDREFTPGAAGRLGDLAFTPGQTVESNLDYASLSFAGTYRFHEYRNRRDQGGWDLDSSLDAVLGARMYDVDFEFTSAAGREQADDFFAEPIAGLQWTLDIGEQFTIGLNLNAGVGPWGDRSSWSFDIAPRFEWRPITHVGVEAGYRLLVNRLSSGDGAEEFEWEGSMAGVFFAVTLRF